MNDVHLFDKGNEFTCLILDSFIACVSKIELKIGTLYIFDQLLNGWFWMEYFHEKVESIVSTFFSILSNTQMLFVLDKPVFESQHEHIQNGISGTEIDIRVSVYSYPMINKVNVKTREFSSIEHDYIDIENATDIDGTYSKYFPVNAFIITLHGFIIEENDFTSYKFWISNSLGDANYTVKLVDAGK